MIINRIYETQNLLSLYLVSFLVGLRTYQRPCSTKLLQMRYCRQNNKPEVQKGTFLSVTQAH
jgi:hypothetical protein